MDATANYDASSRTSSLHSGGPSKTSRDSESTGEIIARFELDIAFICERLTNLNLLSMHVETRESDFEPFVSDMDLELVVKLLEYDLLAGVLGSEVKLLETHISDLQIEKSNVSEFLLSRKHLGEPVVGMEDMLQDSEKSLAQLLEQVLDLKVRSASFERNVLRFAGNDDYIESSKDDIEQKEKMKMQTVEHQRHILRMLEKSLEREIDSEKRVFELTQIEETLTMRVRILEEEVVYAEEVAETTLENFYEADHSSELLMETSKELLGRIKMLHFNLKGSAQREAELESNLLKLQLANEKASTQVKVEKEDNAQELKDSNEKVVSLEKQLSDTNVKLQNVEACYEASLEDKSMLQFTIKDMENVIEDLKRKVTRAEGQTNSMEDKCIFLSEANDDLKKELSTVKGRVKFLETSLHQMEEAKKASAKDISIRSKFITDLVMQMAHQRERLQKQILSLKHENKILVKSLRKRDEGRGGKLSHDDKASSDFTAENKEALSSNSEVEMAGDETVMDSTETVRNIDARQLKLLDMVKVILVLIIPIIGYYFYQYQAV
ncbi:WPP domain-interacting protein 2 [Artemisia annua]|uniref:WPP domain-interacting protein 2 n=1 Tax=Artemisia annua TaxID=35608 RepID=A0A2U1QP26_ARTAN|nr:WPP domain-interacting protein 2 [Artemisia annua]